MKPGQSKPSAAPNEGTLAAIESTLIHSRGAHYVN
jgi:hypothetical protein